MKKILVTALLLLLSLSLTGCVTSPNTDEDTVILPDDTTASTTTLAELKAPENLKIEKGVVSFNEVEGATSYTLKIMQDGALVMNVTVNNGDSLSSLLEDGDYEAQILAKRENEKSSYSEKVSFTIGVKKVDITTLNEISGEYLSSSDYVNMSGRTYYDETTSRMYFYYTASGFKVSFTGTKLDAEIYATNFSKNNLECRIVVLVDGEVYPDGGTTIVLNKGLTATYTLCENLKSGKHTVEVLKRNEAIDNTCALTKLTTDGNFETPEADKEKRILIIGASGSCGYGNLAKDTTVSKNTYNSDGLKAFSYLTARMYDTEVDMVNASGWGVKWGWNSTTGLQNIPMAFARVGIDSTNSILKESYNYALDSYDLIIVNLGMNDFNAYIRNLTGTEKEEKIEEYKAAAKTFYNVLVNAYSCPILLLSTSETNESAEGIYNKEVALEVNASLSSTRLYTLIIPTNGDGTNYGANNHANVQTHIWTADKISAWIESNLNWTKVRDNISYDVTRDQVD